MPTARGFTTRKEKNTIEQFFMGNFIYKKQTMLLKEKAAELSKQGFSLRRIAKILNTSKSTVARWLQEAKQSAEVQEDEENEYDNSIFEQQKNNTDLYIALAMFVFLLILIIWFFYPRRQQ